MASLPSSFVAMLLIALASLSLLAQLALASPVKPRSSVVHERFPIHMPQGWRLDDRMNPDHTFPVRIALKQQNLDKLDDLLMDVSHPQSPNYGKHWTLKQMAEKFAPHPDTIEAVITWLTEEGIARERIRLSDTHSFLRFNASIQEAESLLRTQYHTWTHVETQTSLLAVHPDMHYSVPENVQKHIDFIMPTVQLDTWSVVDRKQRRQRRARAASKWQNDGTTNVTGPIKPINQRPLAQPPSNTSLYNCGSQITLACLQAMYGIPLLPTSIAPTRQNALGVVEYEYDSFVQADLTKFFGLYSRHQVQKAPIIFSIDGGEPNYQNLTTDESKLPMYWDTIESNLDLQYTMGLANPIPVTLFQTGDLYQGASFANFLEALDSSFCQYNDPNFDGVYPDPNGYNGPLACGTVTTPPRVITTSYGGAEQYVTAAYQTRLCQEYGKLSMTGITFAFSSGDQGVGNHQGCYDPVADQFSTTSKAAYQFAPSRDASCPYVLAVGATKLNPGAQVTDQEVAAVDGAFYSGGGFSTFHPRPAYQNTAVTTYLNNTVITYNSTQYNSSGRAFPDVSANGVRYVIALYEGGYSFYLIDGTSASSPTVAAILTILNEQRFRKGKSSLGFVNPAFYNNPSMFNDIVSGSNPGCFTNGFTAATGWDPVTGLGTPNFPKMSSYFLSLP